MKKFLERFRIRKLLLIAADCFIIAIAALISNYILRFFKVQVLYSELTFEIFFGVVCSGMALKVFGAYNKMWRYFKLTDYLSCLEGISVGFALSISLTMLAKQLMGNTVLINVAFTILHFTFSFIGVCLFRFLFKNAFISIKKEGMAEAKKNRAMIVGAGRACELILSEIEGSKRLPSYKLPFTPVCIVDDDREKIGKVISGVPVVGTTLEMEKFIPEFGVEQILFAIPSCPEEERERIITACTDTKLPVKIIPFFGDLIFDEMKEPLVNRIRDIKVEDLLGRDPVKIDDENIKKSLENKVCMVTGGGGSIGSEIARQIASFSPKQIIIVDIYENNAYDIQQELIMNYGDSLDLVVLIASVRDRDRMKRIFEKYHPEIIFHAAAHKHVPLMEMSPMEAIKNNVIGTYNVATLANEYGAEKFVMISTDKAVNPTNVMGASKRCCEMIVQYLSQKPDVHTDYVTTRFGNVLGSNGSVIPIFRRQIEQGKPVTITHPDIIRYFMSIPEATSLVLEAAAMAKGGEIFILDMGKPVKILTLAENLIKMYGKRPYEDVDIKFIGLRPGEKLKEELLLDDEGLKKTSNKLIFIGSQIEIDDAVFIDKLKTPERAAFDNDEEEAVNALRAMVPTFTTPEEFNKKVLA